MPKFLRWALVPVSAAVVWGGVLLLGVEGVTFLDALCPPKLVESGACIAPWREPSLEALMLAGAGLAAFGIVWVSALVAPTHKLRVAALMFGCGAMYAMHLVHAQLVGPFLTAAGGGSAALWLVNLRWKA
jgi:hypothetical protein